MFTQQNSPVSSSPARCSYEFSSFEEKVKDPGSLFSFCKEVFEREDFWDNQFTPRQLRQKIISLANKKVFNQAQWKIIGQILFENWDQINSDKEILTVSDQIFLKKTNVDSKILVNLYTYITENKTHSLEEKEVSQLKEIMETLTDSGLNKSEILENIQSIFSQKTSFQKEELPYYLRFYHLCQLKGKEQDLFDLQTQRAIRLLQVDYNLYYRKNPVEANFSSREDGLYITITSINNINVPNLIKILKEIPEIKVVLHVKSLNFYLFENIIRQVPLQIRELHFSEIEQSLDDLLALTKNVGKLSFKKCQGIENIDFDPPESKSSSLEFRDCHSLKSVSTTADQFSSQSCSALTTLSLDSTSVYCHNCPNLVNLKVNQATKLTLTSCALKTLEAPQALEVQIKDCQALEVITINKAENIDFDRNTALRAIRAPVLNSFDCKSSPNVEEDLLSICYLNRATSDSFKKTLSLLERHSDIDKSGLFLASWFERLYNLPIPMQSEKEAELQICREQIDAFVLELDENLQKYFGSIDLNWLHDCLKDKSNLKKKQKTLLQVYKLAIQLKKENINFFATPNSSAILKSIFSLNQHKVQVYARDALFRLVKEKQQSDGYIDLSLTSDNRLDVMRLFLLEKKISPDVIDRLMKSFEKTFYKPFFYRNLKIVALIFSHPQISNPEALLRVIFEEVVQGKREKKSEFVKRLNFFRTQQSLAINAIKSILALRENENFSNVKNLDDIFKIYESMYSQLLGISQELIPKILEVFASTRIKPDHVLTYASGLALLDLEHYKEVMPDFRECILSIAEGSFPASRYDLEKNIHLKTIFETRPELFKQWQAPCQLQIEEVESLTVKNLKDEIEVHSLPPLPKDIIVKDSDSWEDLLLMGTEVLKSCQHIESSATNVGIIGALACGEIKLVVVKNKKDQIIARAILRILLDKKTKEPVLFMDTIYTRFIFDHPQLDRLILNGCIEKAKSMRLPLLTKPMKIGEEYPNKLIGLNVVTDTYVDAAGGLVHKGESFEVKNCEIAYQP